MKLIAIYNVWDSLELLKGSIEQIRESVDFVLVVAQEVSNSGEVDKRVYPFVNNLIDEKLVDQVLTYEPTGKALLRNETAKRQIGLEFAKTKGFTHFIHLDCDEYYLPAEFKYAVDLIKRNYIQASWVDLYTYYKEPTLRLAKKESYGVPFITRLYPHTQVGMKHRQGYDVPVDPSRAVNVMASRKLVGVSMHHFSYVRQDIKKKLRNSTARNNINRPKVISEYQNAKEGTHLKALFNDELISVENHFNIDINVKEQV